MNPLCMILGHKYDCEYMPSEIPEEERSPLHPGIDTSRVRWSCKRCPHEMILPAGELP